MNTRIKDYLSLFFARAYKTLKSLQNLIKFFELLFSIFLFYFTRSKVPSMS